MKRCIYIKITCIIFSVERQQSTKGDCNLIEKLYMLNIYASFITTKLENLSLH